jgi:voltage-gated potassium channel
MHPFRRLLPAGIILVIIAAAGASGYVAIERWTVLESIYMVVITLFTIGFEEVHPLSPAGMVLTIGVIITGVGTAVYAGGRAVEIIVEGEMSGYHKKKRMDKRIKELKGHYIVCGFGRVGHQVAQAFDASSIPYAVVDSKPETIDELEPRNVPTLIGDVTADDILTKAGITNAKGLVACSDSDVANVYVTLSARALNPGIYIVARAGLKGTEKKLLIAGANRVISPYFISGIRMAALATRPVTSDFLDLVTHGGQVDFRLFEVLVPEGSPLGGKNLGEANIRAKAGAVVLAIRKADGSFDLQPSSSSMIQQGDVLVVLGTQTQFEALEAMIASSTTSRQKP